MPWEALGRLIFIGGFALAVVLFYWAVSFFWLGPEKKEREYGIQKADGSKERDWVFCL
ncbi:hypothetical protein [Alkalicoccus saliphilus]|uniref:hypothetical protein n=1 Tax=Alkalicoccus saliphilus TaxID=200989 RepID=UPI0013572240|nr:hypothetical protein [Alkalicoccus saliphilus]